MRRIVFLCAASIAAVGVSTSAAQTSSRVIRLIDQRCAGCHVDARAERAPTVEGAPPPAALRRMTAETIFQAMTRGSMRAHVEDVADDVKRAMAEFLSGRKLGGTAGADAQAMPNRCSSDRRVGDLSAGPSWNGWSPDSANARFQKAGGLAPDAVPRLKLEMGVRVPRRGPRCTDSPPSPAGGSSSGWIPATLLADAATGCVHWSFQAETGVRNAISVGPVDMHRVRARLVYSGTFAANVYSLDAATGELLSGRSSPTRIRSRRSQGRQRCTRSPVDSGLLP